MLCDAWAVSSDTWDARYAEAREAGQTVWSAGPNIIVETELSTLPPATAIDLGAGEGRNALWLAERGWQVTAVDFSAVGIETGRQNAVSRGVGLDWVVADVTTWTPPHPVDLVLVAYLHLPSAVFRPLFQRIESMLAAGGNLLVVGHAVENLTEGVGGPQDPDVLYPAGLPTAGLTVTRDDLVRRILPDGRSAIDRLLRAQKQRDWR